MKLAQTLSVLLLCPIIAFGQTTNQRLSKIEQRIATVESQLGLILGRFDKLEADHVIIQDSLDEILELLKVPPVIPPTEPPVDPPVPDSPYEIYNIAPIAECETSEPIIIKGGTYSLDKNLKFAKDGFIIAGPNVTLDLNGKTVYFNTSQTNGNWGILSYRNREPYNTKYQIPDAQNAQNLVIKNGNLIGLDGNNVVCVEGYTADNISIENVFLETKSGADSMCVNFEWGQLSIKNSTSVCGATSTNNRHLLPANIRIANGGINADRNIIIGGNSGIVSAHRTPNYGGESFITNNFISHNSFDTNGYGFFQAIATNNVIMPIKSGRGFYLGSNLCRGENNVVLAWERPNAEFGYELNAPIIRSRYGTNNTIAKNNFGLAIGGGDFVSCSGLYLSNYDTTNTYTQNVFLAINLGETNQQTAKAITLEGQGGDSGQYTNRDQITYNKFYSNEYLISTSGYDGACWMESPLSNNTINFVNGEFAWLAYKGVLDAKLTELQFKDHPVVSDVYKKVFENLAILKTVPKLPSAKKFFTGHWGDKEKITLLDTTQTTGQPSLSQIMVTADDFYYSERNSIRKYLIGLSKAITVIKNGQPLPNTKLTVTTEFGDSYSYTSDNAGKATIPNITEIWENSGANKGVFVKKLNAKMFVNGKEVVGDTVTL